MFPAFGSGDLCANYNEICDQEQKADKNPGNKGAFNTISKTIRENCMRFTNHVNACKVHFPKAPAKAKAKKGTVKDEVAE